MTEPADIQVCICGGGNASHVMIGHLAAAGYKVNVYAPYADEAERLTNGTQKHSGVKVIYNYRDGEERVGMPQRISRDASDVVPGSKYVFMPLPTFAHEATMTGVVPFCDPDAVLVALPATAGFDWNARKVFKALGREVHIAGIAPLPYVCRIEDYGAQVRLFGTKSAVGMATNPPHLVEKITPVLEKMLGFTIEAYTSFLSVTLTPTNPIMHTARMYGMLVASKDGHWRTRAVPFTKNPRFYDDCCEESSEWLHRLDAENQKIAEACEAQIPGSISGHVKPINHFLKWTYGDNISKWDTAGDCYRTNKSFHGMGSPMYEVAADYWVPDFRNRYFTEDFPCGLMANRGLAELLGVATPDMDTVIEWAQGEMQKKWLVGGKVNLDEKGVMSPQHFGLSLADLQKMYKQ